MRPGDNIDAYKGKWWTVVFVGEFSRLCPDFRSGRWVYMMSPRPLLDGSTQLVARLEHEDDLRAHWSKGPTFVPGEPALRHAYPADKNRLHAKHIHAVTDHFITLVDDAGRFTVEWRWRLALLRDCPFFDFDTASFDDSFLRADHLGAA